MRFVSLLISLLAMLTATSAAHAQSRSLDLERLRPAADRDGFIGIAGTRTPGEWAWNATLFTGYQLDPLTIRRIGEEGRTSIVAHRVSAELLAQLGITDRAALVLRAPVVLYQDTNGTALGGTPISSAAMRDGYVGTRVRILGEGADGEHGRNEGPGLAAQAGLTIPWGLEEAFAGEGEPQLDVQVLGDFHFLDFGIGGVIGYRHRFAEPELLSVVFTNELFFGAALSVPAVVVPNLRAMIEFRVTTALDQEAFQDASTAFEGDLGARWAEGDVALTWAVGMGFNGGVGLPAVRGLFGIEFAPRTHDGDGDGLEDSDDECVRLPEDMDGFEDEDGCPDPDNDGDLVPDPDDRCPDEAADFDRDEDQDGCTDPVRDQDGDGIEDREDPCPAEAEDQDDFEDEDGCPDLDDDGDGVPDTSDRCRREPEDRDGFEDEDGCPDLDDDEDGIADTDDACRTEAEDMDGFEDEDGCPEPDNDRDGILDADDQCGDEPETINGFEDEDGCADRRGRSLWSQQDDGPLTGRVRFTAAGGIRAASMNGVSQLALHLRAGAGQRWELRIAGFDETRRAALRTALEERGVPRTAFAIEAGEGLSTGSVEVHPAAPQ
ncbi:MAG: hypothetical protein AB8I08_14930 [Sandaracinaceae bacterium]